MSVNLAHCARELWDRTVENEVLLALPLLAMLKEHQNLTVSGTALKFTVIMDDLESVAQDYEVNDPLTVGEKTVTQNVQWNWKKTQLPVTYDVDDQIEGEGDAATAPVKVVDTIVEAGQTGMRKHLNTLLYGAAADAGKATFQGLRSALTHDTTYGGLGRLIATPLNTWWQGASLADTYVDQAVATVPTMAMLRHAATHCRRHVKPNTRLYCITSEQIYAQFVSQAEARNIYTTEGVRLLKYGFASFMVDTNIEMVCDSYLTTSSHPTWFFLLNPETWEFRIKPERNFKMTPFKWLGEQANGLDKMLARILVAGNLICRKPNANIYLSNVA
jgi:hypothetical protein